MLLLVAEITLATLILIILVLLALGFGLLVLFYYGPETFARMINAPFEMMRSWRQRVRDFMPSWWPF